MGLDMDIKFISHKKALDLDINEGFVVCGDVHLINATTYINSYNGVFSNRLLELYEQLYNACMTAKQLKLPFIINGDLITTGLFDYPVEKLLTDLLLEFQDVEIYINLGNHDLDGKNSVIEPLIAVNKTSHHKVFSKPSIESYITRYDELEKALFVFIPFMSDEDTNKYLNSLKKDKYAKTIIFIHNSFMGSKFANKIKSKSGISQTVFTQGKLKWVDMIVASHIHKYQILCRGKGFYTSSLMPVDFGERTREHGYHVIDLKENKRYFVVHSGSRFVYIDIDDNHTPEELKKKVKNNIIKILYDKNKQINKEKIKSKFIEAGAKFVSFKTKNETTKYSGAKTSKGSINEVDAIVSEFSAILAEKYGLKEEQIEQIGFEILETSKKKLGIKTQKR
jgi:DNA repair exonuclease SbcCD nuclease subunit